MDGMRRVLVVVVVMLGIGLGLLLGHLRSSTKPPPDPAAVVERIRELARLEVLEVSLYKKITHTPAPSPADSFWGDVLGWARHTFTTPRGKAIVFADARLGIDLDKLGPDGIRVEGRTVLVVLPALKVTVDLKPDETEVIGSNLDTRETAELFALAKAAFEREVRASAPLRERARASAERAIRAFLLSVGFAEVRFVDALPGVAA